MSVYTAISAVSQSLLGVLLRAMKDDPTTWQHLGHEDDLSLLSPSELKDSHEAHLSIYLYRVVEDAYMKNQYPVPGTGGRLRKPPLTLDLHYLITPLFGSAEDQQVVLGKVLQVLYDHPTLGGPDLVGDLEGTDAEVRVLLNPVTLEETTRIWTAMEMSYRLSLCYVLRVALIDSTVETAVQPVVARNGAYGQK